MKKILITLTFLLISVLFASCNAKPIVLNIDNFKEVSNNIEKYKGKKVEVQGFVSFPSESKKVVTLFVGNGQTPGAAIELSNENDLTCHEGSELKITGKITGKSGNGFVEFLNIEVAQTEIVQDFYDVDKVKDDPVSIFLADYPHLVSDVRSNLNKVVELEGEITGEYPISDERFGYDLTPTGYLTPSIHIICEKKLDYLSKTPFNIKIKGVVRQYPLDNSAIIIVTSIEEVAVVVPETAVSQSSTDKKSDQAPSNSGGEISLEKAIAILNKKFPETTCENYPESDYTDEEGNYYYYFNMVTGTSAAYEMYVSKQTGELFVNSSYDGSIQLEPYIE